MKLYREVKASERLPETIEEFYHTNRGYLFFNQAKLFCDDHMFPIYSAKVKWWLEPIYITEEEIKVLWDKHYAIGSQLKIQDGYMLYHGFRAAILSKLKGE